jgi:hypothetical protein
MIFNIATFPLGIIGVCGLCCEFPIIYDKLPYLSPTIKSILPNRLVDGIVNVWGAIVKDID